MANKKNLVYIKDIETYFKSLSADETCPLHIAAEIDYILESIEPVDAVEVIHGRWKKTAYSGVSRCSCCDKPSSTPDCLDEFFNYCPNCGAKMDKEDID